MATITHKIRVTLDGETFEDMASGNTEPTAQAAINGLIRSYENEGATVVRLDR